MTCLFPPLTSVQNFRRTQPEQHADRRDASRQGDGKHQHRDNRNHHQLHFDGGVEYRAADDLREAEADEIPDHSSGNAGNHDLRQHQCGDFSVRGADGLQKADLAAPLHHAGCDKVRDAFNTLAEIFGVKLDEDKLEDSVSEVRDEVLDRFEKMTNGEVIFGSDSY